MFISCGWGNSGLWRRNGAKRFNYYQRPPMLTGQPPNLPIIGRRVNAERQSLKLRAEIISLAAAFNYAFVKHLETGLLHLGALVLDIILHNLESNERATKPRRNIACSSLVHLDPLLYPPPPASPP